MQADGLHCLVVFTVEGQRYGLPLATVERVLPMVAITPLPKAPAITVGAINVRGQIVPVLDLRRRLGFPAREFALGHHLLVARAGRRPVALPVDEALGILDVPGASVRSPSEILPGIAGVQGVVALPDGLLLIHDLEAFLSLEEGQQLAAALGGAEA